MSAPCIVCHAAGDCRHKRTDAAVLANRADPTIHNYERVLLAMRDSTDEFYREQAAEFIGRTSR